MNKLCHCCPVSALCLDRDGPEELQLAKCALCSATLMLVGDSFKIVEHFKCWRNYIIFRDYHQQDPLLMKRCPQCRQRESIGWVRFVI